MCYLVIITLAAEVVSMTMNKKMQNIRNKLDEQVIRHTHSKWGWWHQCMVRKLKEWENCKGN